MAQNLKDDLMDTHHEIDFIAGPDAYRELPSLIAQSRRDGEKGRALKLSRTETYSGVDPLRSGGVNAWIAVMRGCDNMCTFCVVPFTRGRERSRSPRGILAEVESLAEAGYAQVTLLGQNVNSYKYENYRFGDLVRMVADVPRIQRVRFTSPHPKDFPEDLLRVITTHPNVCSHIHLPLQSGNNRILELMKRTYTIESFRELVANIRDMNPGIALTTDIIVGFPTESDEEYEETYRAMAEIRFDAAFIFNYSERKGTYAERKLIDDVGPEVKRNRIVKLIELQKQITGEKNEELVGRTLEILAEEPLKKDPTRLIGRTDTFKNTVFPAEHYEAGDLVNVLIEHSRGGTLHGRAVGLSQSSVHERLRRRSIV
jgi:tRNA-2-methylthio-N6-dimethylallyladenosine synthase